jgi:uncharacterized protein with beta-barrel porin domain
MNRSLGDSIIAIESTGSIAGGVATGIDTSVDGSLRIGIVMGVVICSFSWLSIVFISLFLYIKLI